jgi:predicted transcriptional regulator
MEQDLDYLRQSETVQYYLRMDANGQRVNDIAALDRGIRDLHARCRKAEKEAQTYMAEAVLYRRKYEALELERKEEEENRFPLFNNHKRADENEHPQACVSCCGN